MKYHTLIPFQIEKRLTDDNIKLSDLLGKDGPPDLRLRRIALALKHADGAMKLDSIFYMVPPPLLAFTFLFSYTV
jgi:hypothetical protein